MSEESLHIMGLPGIYATMQWMCMLPAWRSQLLRTHLFPSTGGPPEATGGTDIDGGPRWVRRTGVNGSYMTIAFNSGDVTLYNSCAF